MKENFIIFVIGILLGAVISTGAFFVYTTTNNNCSNQNAITNGGNTQEMPNGQPPEKPEGANMGEPPEMQNNNTQSNN